MTSVARIAVHASQFPENVRRDLLASLRARAVNHKFHYDSVKQTQQWLALHEACSPSRTARDCAKAYADSFAAAALRISAPRVHLIGLGCGGGRKDTRLLRRLQRRGRELFYTPCDVSAAMVLVARRTALAAVADRNCFPFVCDLASATDLPAVWPRPPGPAAARLVTFFGMIPNFEPGMILPKLAALVRAGDHLLFSANLAPGTDYTAGMKKILPQYDNELTRDWLMTFLLDLGVERRDGDVRFVIENGGNGLKRVAAYFRFARARKVVVAGEPFAFRVGEAIRLFFSYRHTPDTIGRLLRKHGLTVLGQWIAKSEEEGVFLCRRG